jgi:REP element-mobilizing transposase RayT
MARGDGGKRVFINDEEAKGFLFRLEQVCQKNGWRVHAWVLMSNHYHLLIDTPEPNLTAGMRVLMGTFSQGWNRRHMRRGHVFQGRYKAIPVSGDRAQDASYLKVVADYIHLNPARAGLAGGRKGKLVDYPWSSLKHYAKGILPPSMEIERVMDGFQLDHGARGRRAYVQWLEARASNPKKAIDKAATKALRRGWYLGEDGFRDKLLKLVGKAKRRIVKSGHHSGAPLLAHDEQAAERLITRMTSTLGLAADTDWTSLRKNHREKLIVAAVVKRNTAMKNQWLSDRLHLGHVAGMCRNLSELMQDPTAAAIITRHERSIK